MKSYYGQYCPLALASELLCRRWTILIISRLFDGCEQFNDIHRGIPRISPSLLSQRLTELQEAGLVYRKNLQNKRGYSYHLTEASTGLEELINRMAVWGQAWARDMVAEDLDLSFLAWSMHLRMNIELMPAGRNVIEFFLSGAPADCRQFWLVKEHDRVEMCLKYPGFDTDLLVAADLLEFVEAWRGLRDLRKEIKANRVRLSGPPKLVRDFPDWLQLSMFAEHQRLKPGRESALNR